MEKSNVVVYHLYVTVSVTENVTKITSDVKIIEFKDIESAKVEISQLNTGATILISLTPILLVGLFFLIILISMSIGGFKVG